MKILKSGNTRHVLICKCGCEFECLESEGVVVGNYWLLKNAGRTFEINCPECGSQLEKKIPSPVMPALAGWQK